MAGDTVARSVNKFIYIRVGGQIRWIYPPLNKPKTLPTMRSHSRKFTADNLRSPSAEKDKKIKDG
jgi:hypothetical protein